MVAPPASQPGRFSPVDPPVVAIASDGTLAAIHEASRVTILEIPSGAAFAEIGVDPAAMVTDVAWVGSTPRLLVLSRYPAYSTAHLLDPYGPRTIAEIRLESPMRLFATVGAYALVVGTLGGAAVLGATETHLTPYQFPARTTPVAAGAAAGQFVVALAGSIEEWDPQSRMPKRRLRLPRAAAITAVGGSERVVWMTTQHEPARIDVIPLVNRGQPKAHDLPEPIERVSGHPRSDLVVCVGADSGRLYVVDLDGRTRLRVFEPDGLDRISAAGLVIGRMIGVVAAQALRPVAIVAFDGRELDVEPAGAPEPDEPRREPASTLGEPQAAGLDGSSGEVASVRPPGPPAAAAATARLAPAPAPASLFRASAGPAPQARAAPPPIVKPIASASERFAAWRDLVRHNQPRIEPIAAPRAQAGPALHTELVRSWRDEVAAWARAVVAGALDRDPPRAPAIDALIARFELALQLSPVLALLYGAHLCGERGAAPIDVARVLDRQWDEALGRGELAERGVAVYADSRIALAPVLRRVLDELPPATGVLVGEPSTVSLLGPCFVVAGDEPLAELAERYRERVGGAILAAHGDPDRGALVFEARAYGAAAMLRVALAAAPREPAIFVVDDPELADRLGVPRLA
jgi:hypothetical protein